ncbi:S1C family serine protease [Clostridium sp. MSJ-4]|uniref:S1C family serine protease n=1 Tax=Clostridium simiarum TaxID=2841506 RepID=A0ABS6F132_9CLOT|nr:trypsin-like peptidase domain-containing protein [Clostridium simiarum]MBU5592105.1 S1C family serine protease [Clostridium simiarum]
MEREDKLNKDISVNYDLKFNEEERVEPCANYGEINIRQSKKRRKIKYFCKGVSLMLIAAFSGALSATYIIEKKYSKIMQSKNNNSIIYSNKERDLKDDTSKEIVPKNDINKVVEGLSDVIVGVSNKEDSFSKNEISKNIGSGIIFDKSGYIVTNSSLVDEVQEIYVKLSSYGAKPMLAKVVGLDRGSDLAVIKIEQDNLPYAKFGDSEKVRAGDLAIAVGNPLGENMSGAVTMGIVSMPNKKLEYVDPKTGEKSSYKVIKTDTNINAYNTGGALCNSIGEIIGINSAKLTNQYISEGMGVSIPSNEVTHIVKSLTDYGKVNKPHLGFVGQTVVRNNNSENFGVEGVYVREVTQGETLHNAGVRATDIIVELDHKEVKKMSDIQNTVDEHKVGDLINCKIWRDGSVLKLDLTLTEKK